VVLGDVMIDSYLKGKVERISPEAPVPVLDVKSSEKRLGGAGNVALNIQALGAKVRLCSLIGDDQDGDEFLSLMDQARLDSSLIYRESSRKTSIKHRLIAGTQQLLRVDEEDRSPIKAASSDALLEMLSKLLSSEKLDALIIQDYNKGLLSENLIKEVISLCNEKGIHLSVDPKKDNFLNFENCDLFKPNLKELKEGLNLKLDAVNQKELDDAIVQLKQSMPCKELMITLSEKGIYGNSGKSSFILPAKIRDISDVSGAGDTVISLASLCLVSGCDLKMASRLANLAGGLVCEMLGVVPIDKELLLQEAIISIK